MFNIIKINKIVSRNIDLDQEPKLCKKYVNIRRELMFFYRYE